MELNAIEWRSATMVDAERPSEDFIRAVADLLETDADNILSEMGYQYTEVAEATVQPVDA